MIAADFQRIAPNERETMFPQEGVRPARGYWRTSLAALRRNWLGMLCLVVVLVLVLVAVCAPMLSPFNPEVQELSQRLASPDAVHPLGTDELGRDILSRLMYGCRISLSVGVLSQVLALVLGFVLGACAGYLGGRFDEAISFTIQVFSSFPFLLFSLVVMYALGPGLKNIYVTLGLLMWTTPARLVRGEVLRLKQSEYVLSCIVCGGSAWRVVTRHLLPNCASTLVVAATLGIPNAILCEASLSFLGLGVQPPMASWGQMVSASRSYLQASPWYALAPGLAIILCVVAFNLLGDALRDAFDPRLSHRG